MGNTVTHIRGLHLFPSSSFKSTQQKKQQRNSLKGERGEGKKIDSTRSIEPAVYTRNVQRDLVLPREREWMESIG